MAEEQIIITERPGHVLVQVPKGPFPWARFLIACVVISLVWMILLPYLISWHDTGRALLESEYRWPLRLVGAPLFLTAYFLVTFHGFSMPNDSFSYYLSSAFHHFDIEADRENVSIRKYWLLRTQTQTIQTKFVRGFAIDDGWFVCRTTTSPIVICDGPPSAVIAEPMAALNRVVAKD